MAKLTRRSRSNRLAIVRRRRSHAVRNPTGQGAVGKAVGTNALFALVGGVLGAVVYAPRASGAVGGAQSGLVLASLGSLVVAAISKPLRTQALVTAGVGLGGILLVGLLWSLAPATRTATAQ